MRRGRSTMRRCAACRDSICQECRTEHEEMDCEMAGARVCVVYGGTLKANACGKCGTWFCCRHRDHDCPTPQPGDRATGRAADFPRTPPMTGRGTSQSSGLRRQAAGNLRKDVRRGWTLGTRKLGKADVREARSFSREPGPRRCPRRSSGAVDSWSSPCLVTGIDRGPGRTRR